MYFSLAFPYGETWAAVGMGSDVMKGSLVLMAYASADAQNVTFSPRLAHSETEPQYYPELEYETIVNSTGLVNQSTFMYSAVCHNCRTWPNGGKIDVNSTAEKFIFATGPNGDLTTNNKQESVRKHSEHGVFMMDLQHATGNAGPVVLNASTVDDGATLVGKLTENDRDWFAVFHAIIMIGCFVGLLPLGVLLLKLGKWVRWHGINQGFALVVILVGFGLGVKTSTFYNRVSCHSDGRPNTFWRPPLRLTEPNSRETLTRRIKSLAYWCLSSSLPNSCWATCTIVRTRRPKRGPRRRPSILGLGGLLLFSVLSTVSCASEQLIIPTNKLCFERANLSNVAVAFLWHQTRLTTMPSVGSYLLFSVSPQSLS